MKTTKDCYVNGKWLQRTTVNGKYVWTTSGVLWNGIKERCKIGGGTQTREPSYLNASNLFKSFEDFVDWNRGQIGYDIGYELDSDILKKEFKVYSRETCLLIPPDLNRFIQSRVKSRKQDLPTGIFKSRNKLVVKVHFKGVESLDKSLLNKSFDVGDILSAKEFYEKAVNYCAEIWVDRLKNSGNYFVDKRVISYMENFKYESNWRLT